LSVKTSRFIPDAYLDGPEGYAAYLDEAFASGDPREVADALGVIARAKGMSQLSLETGLPRATLYKALSDTGNPELATVLRVAHALGLRLGARVPEHA